MSTADARADRPPTRWARVATLPSVESGADDMTVEVVVGRVGKAHGLRGDVVVDVRTDEPTRRFATGTSFETPGGALTVRSTHWHGIRLLVHFDTVDDRDAAEALRGVELRLVVPAAERPDDPEEFYDHQLVGLAVIEPAGVRAGHVTEVLHLPAQDLLAVRRFDGSDVLVPFVRDLVPTVDLSSGRLELAQATDWLSEYAGAPDDSVLDEPEQR